MRISKQRHSWLLRYLTDNRGFNLVSLVVALIIAALIVGIAIPQFRAIRREGEYTKVEHELQTLKLAVGSYWRHNGRTFPSNITTDVTGATPNIVPQILSDPWVTDSTNSTYGYTSASNATFGNYFIIYTRGPDQDTAPVFVDGNQRVEYTGSGRAVSNAPVEKN